MRNAVNRLLNKFLIIEDGYKLDLNKYKTSKINSEKFNFSKLNLEELNFIMSSYPNEISYEKYLILKQRIYEKDVEVFCIKNNSDILGYFCISFIDIKEGGINYVINVGNDSAYLFDDYVFIKNRGRGAQKYSIDKRLEYAVQLGKKNGIVNVYSWNVKSIINYRELGFEPYIRYYYFKIIKKIYIK